MPNGFALCQINPFTYDRETQGLYAGFVRAPEESAHCPLLVTHVHGFIDSGKWWNITTKRRSTTPRTDGSRQFPALLTRKQAVRSFAQ